MSTFITGIKNTLYRHAPLRVLCYLLVALALLLYWLYTGGAEVSFVYNAF